MDRPGPFCEFFDTNPQTNDRGIRTHRNPIPTKDQESQD